MRSSQRYVALPLLVAALLACGKKPAKTQPEPELWTSSSEIALTIENHNWLDITIFVIHNGERTRVGTVTGTSSTTFFLKPYDLGMGREIRLMADPVGSSEVIATEILVIQPGQYIQWNLETQLSRSSVAVY
jgi:hypothetical protein